MMVKSGDDRSRNTSVTEIDQSDFLCRQFAYQKTLRLLDLYYGMVKRKILRYQSPTTGLFPHSSDNAVEGHVRDSIYCAAALWSLFQAFRHIDNDKGKSYEMGQSAVKCMRGILFCWMKQAYLLEEFKKNQVPKVALHSKFHLVTGEPIVTTESYGHLQLDVPSLYIIYLVQMITSGLEIIYSMDEVCFIQNLVYYIERGYRTPDFGMWERGTKYNTGTPEVHASSIGFVKAALETVSGCNLFGEKGTAYSVVYMDIDAHNRNRSIFEMLLPRESSSKNTDIALLPTISFPAFATHDEALYDETKKKIIRKLKGEYGFKRFLRDGYGTSIEDKSKRFYNVEEIKDFDGIESEWPIFYIYMIIDGVFKGLQQQVSEYQKLLSDRLFHDRQEGALVPKYYYVTEECVNFERKHPGSNPRIAGAEGSHSRRIFLWGEALYIISQLLVENILHINELDPVRRYLPSFCRPRRSGRYSAFQGIATDLVVQVALISESMRLQAMMATYGIQTQTPHEVEPLQIWSQNQLVKAYESLGVNAKLGLTGRPSRPIGALGTSKIYRLLGHTVLCFPTLFDTGDFYLSHDMSLLIDDIKNELHFVGRYWRLHGRPTCLIVLREEHMRDVKFREMLDLLAMLKGGSCDNLQVHVGRVQNLISASCIEHLDFLSSSKLDVNTDFTPFTQLIHKSVGYQSLTDIPNAVSLEEATQDFTGFEKKSTQELMELLNYYTTRYAQCQLLGIIYKRHGPTHLISTECTVKSRLEVLSNEAGMLRHWQVVRYCNSILKKVVDSISPYITAILVHGKQISFGIVESREVIINRPLNPSEAKAVIYETLIDPYQAVLQQEILSYVGKLMLTQEGLFTGILSVRIGSIIHAMTLYMSHFSDEIEPLETLAPSQIRKLLGQMLNVKEWRKNPKCTPLVQRQIEGGLGRVPQDFYKNVWNIMAKSPGGLIIAGHQLPQQPTISNMTMQELDFSLLIESMLNKIRIPEHRQIIVELIIVVSVILERNPELIVEAVIDTDQIVKEANEMYFADNEITQTSNQFYSVSPCVTSRYLARAAVNFILKECTSTVLQVSACDVM